uniref:NADH-ubiquinone oxidoreductase chain 2 n=1 Tax=Cephalopina titillator TaxID=2707115 RepID=A0A6C0U8J9_9MUSC|nr:NADH dehydrogenase subunit 2 [Cephalopina titillator]QIB71446.1 NADH dehydrogenase subunit 2 [Cephalopina titillator]
MINNSSKLMFLSILIMGTIISISANSWLSAWMGLEINLLAFIPLMKDNKLMSTEASLKYFLVQAMASSALLFAAILMMLNYNQMFAWSAMLMIFSSLLLKSGSAPLHFWFPNVIEGMTWMNAFILMTWQKIAPLTLISYTMEQPLILVSVFLSTMIGALGGLNQTSLRKLMAYSSINHLGWMLAAIYENNLIWTSYFLIYTFLLISMISTFYMTETSFMSQLYTFFPSKMLKFFTFMNLLSLGGLPPFLGFFPKWIIIQSLTDSNYLFTITWMVFMTLITLYFYIRLTYSAFMMNHYENNWMNYLLNNNHSYYLLFTSSLISLIGFFLLSPLYYLL